MATLGTTAQIREKVRRRLGYAMNTTLLPDDTLDEILDDALRFLNKYWPSYVVGSFPTVADQQAYSPMPSTGQEIVKVFWTACACAAALADAWPSLYAADYRDSFQTDEQGRTWSPDPSALLIARRYADTMRHTFGKEAVRWDYNSVYLVPPPSTSGTDVYYVYATDRFETVEDITTQVPTLVEAFWAAAMASGHGTLSTGAGAISKIEEPDGTKVAIDVAQHAKAATEATDRMYELTPLAFSWWSAPTGC